MPMKKGHDSVFAAQSSVSIFVVGRCNLKEPFSYLEVDKEDVTVSRKQLMHKTGWKRCNMTFQWSFLRNFVFLG